MKLCDGVTSPPFDKAAIQGAVFCNELLSDDFFPKNGNSARNFDATYPPTYLRPSESQSNEEILKGEEQYS